MLNLIVFSQLNDLEVFVEQKVISYAKKVNLEKLVIYYTFTNL